MELLSQDEGLKTLLDKDIKSILIADDDLILSQNFAFYFSDRFNVLTASDGREALSVLMENKIDLLITDIEMPDIDGIELIYQIRLIDQQLPIIVMTGFGTKDIAIKALKMGVIDFVEKPFKPEVILKVIQQVFDRRREFRITLNTQLKVDDNKVFEMITTNISREGIFVETSHPIQLDETIEFKLKLVEHYPEIHGRGVVKWLRENNQHSTGMGIKFLELYGQSKEIINNFIEIRFRKQLLNSDNIQQYAPMIYLDLDDIKTEIYRIGHTELHDLIQNFATEYNHFGKRDPFIWRWAYEGVVVTCLNTVESRWRESVHLTKVLGIMFVCLIDDIADEIKDKIFLNEALKIPFASQDICYENLSQLHQKYLKFALKLWLVIERRLQSYPRYEEFKEILEFDNWMLANSMRHSFLINTKNYLLNLAEHDIYAPHNMYMVFMNMVDLCCSPTFQIHELGMVREVFLTAQKMGRIGNMITTWEREIYECDFSSGIFAYGLVHKIFTLEELNSCEPVEIIQRIKDAQIEEYFILEWEKKYSKINQLSSSIDSLDIKQLLVGLEKLFRIHLGSRGLK